MQFQTLLKPNQVADALGVSIATLDRWRQLGCGPRFIKLTRGRQGVIRYRPDDLAAFVKSREQASTSETTRTNVATIRSTSRGQNKRPGGRS